MTAINLVLPAEPSFGSTLFATVAIEGGVDAVTSISSTGATWYRAHLHEDVTATPILRIEIWVAENITGGTGSENITVNVSGTSPATAIAGEASNLASTPPDYDTDLVDIVYQDDGSSSSPSISDSFGPEPRQGRELFIAAIATHGHEAVDMTAGSQSNGWYFFGAANAGSVAVSVGLKEAEIIEGYDTAFDLGGPSSEYSGAVISLYGLPPPFVETDLSVAVKGIGEETSSDLDLTVAAELETDPLDLDVAVAEALLIPNTLMNLFVADTVEVTSDLDVVINATLTTDTSLDVSVKISDYVGSLMDVLLDDPPNVKADLDVAVSTQGFYFQSTDVLHAFGPLPLNAGMDMWIAEGGAQSQLFALDTTVSTPVISGQNLVNDPAVALTYFIGNLDDDVVDLLVGPNAVGVLAIYGFVNNGDGSGTFVVDFDPNIPSRQLSIIARDDVDNESAESPLFIVNSLQRVRLNDVMTIRPQELSADTTCQSMLDAVPESNFILRKQFTLPYSFNPTTFELRAVTPSEPVTVTVRRRALPGDPGETQQYVIIPENEVELLKVRLGKGINVLRVEDRFGRTETIIVASTTYMTILCAYAREIHNNSQIIIDEQEAAIFSPVSTRIAEPFLRFNDLLPDVRAQQVLATKLAVRALVAGAGRQIGVRDILAALTLSTPIFVEEKPEEEFFEPAIIPMFNEQEAFAGVEAHVWLANECVRRWQAFVHILSNLDIFQVLSISENSVIFRDENGDVRRHVFDFKDDKCSLTNLALRSICFEVIDVNVAVFNILNVNLCAAEYPFDMRPVPNFPIYPMPDEGVPFGIDPGFDGHPSFVITDHWDGGVLLDSQGPKPSIASGEDLCVFDNGYLVTPLALGSGEAVINEFIQVEAEYTVSPAAGVSLDVSIDLQNVKITTGLSISIGKSQKTASMDMLVSAVQEATAGMSVIISDPAP